MQKHERGAKAFSILPLCTFASKHVTIDTGILRGLLLRVAKRHGLCTKPPPNEAVFREAKDTYWNAHFRLTKAEGQNNRRDFKHIIKTDGYAVSVILTKDTNNNIGNKKRKKTTTSSLPPNIDLTGKRVVGLDPGRADLVSCAWFTPPVVDGKEQQQQPMFAHYSNGEYQQKIGLNTALVKRKLWMRVADLEEALTQLPSGKVASSAAMEVHIYELFIILDRVLELNGRRRVRDQRFSQYCLRQRVMHDICKRITTSPDTTDKRSTVVAFGAGMFSSCSRGHAPGPVKGVRRALRDRASMRTTPVSCATVATQSCWPCTVREDIGAAAKPFTECDAVYQRHVCAIR